MQTLSNNCRVLIVVQNLPVPFDRRVWLEAKTLEQHGYTVNIICPTGQHGDFQARHVVCDNITIHRYPAPPDGQSVLSYVYEFMYCWFWTAFLSWRIWRTQFFDVMHICNPPETYFTLAYLYKLVGVRIIFDHHDLSPEMYIAKGGVENGLLHRGLMWLEKRMVRGADYIITTNETQRIIASERAGVAKSKFTIVRSGPAADSLYPVPQAEYPPLASQYDYLIVYLGEMCSQDGVDILMHVAHYIAQQRDDTHFVLLGGGPALADIKALAQTLGVTSHVTFLGRVNNDSIRRYLSAAAICVVPDPVTPYGHAASMNKVVEYMMFGKPIVGFALTENIITAQTAGCFVDDSNPEILGDAIMTLLDNPEKREHMGAFARQRALSKLMWDFSVEPLLSVYEKVRL